MRSGLKPHLAPASGAGQQDTPSPAACFHRCFQSGSLETREAMRAMRAFLLAQGVAPDAAATVEQVLAEVCNNVTEHAYAQASGPMELCVRLEHRAAHCRIVDQGLALPAGTPPNGPPVNPRDLPEGGFGWYIIRSLTSALDYRSVDGHNELRLSVKL